MFIKCTVDRKVIIRSQALRYFYFCRDLVLIWTVTWKGSHFSSQLCAIPHQSNHAFSKMKELMINELEEAVIFVPHCSLCINYLSHAELSDPCINTADSFYYGFILLWIPLNIILKLESMYLRHIMIQNPKM